MRRRVTILNVWIDKVSSEIALSVQRQYSIALRGCSAMSRQLEAPLVHREPGCVSPPTAFEMYHG